MTEPRQIKCISCGAPLQYAADEKAVTCKFCGSTTLLDDGDSVAKTRDDRESIAKMKAEEFQNQIRDIQAKVKSKSIFASCLIFLIIFGFVGGILILTTNPLWLPFLRARRWDGKKTFACKTNEEFKLKNKNANIAGGPAIKVEDNCHITCTNCNLKGETAIEIHGNGKVTCNNCALIGDEAAVLVDINGELIINGGTMTGSEAGIKMETNGSLQATSITIRGDIGIDAGEGANPEIKLRDVTIEAVSAAFVLGGNTKLDARNTKAKAAVGIKAAGNTKVSYRGGSLEATDLAVEQMSNARIEFKENPKVTGRVKSYREGYIEGLPLP